MTACRTVYLKPDDDLAEDEALRFHLTYEGELKARQRNLDTGQWDKQAGHVQSIRKVFHKQLKQLWANNNFLTRHTVGSLDYGHKRLVDLVGFWVDGDTKTPRLPLAEAVANNYRENDYRFVPLVREQWSLSCSLDVLFLRRDPPGSVVSAGDLDNRLKTLIDALRKPANASELRQNPIPEDGEDPFFCLLEDDKLMTGLSVTTDRLLDPMTSANADEDRRNVRTVISVEVRPYDVTLFNQSFS